MTSHRPSTASRVALAILLSCVASQVRAGANAGGTLIVHCDPAPASSQEYSCTSHGLSDCAAANVRVDDGVAHQWWVLAAFAEGSAPRLAGLTFGVSYPLGVEILSHAHCANFELSTDDWPSSGSGTALTWNAARTDHLTPVYMFAGYNYYAPAPALFALAPHPTQGASFGDDSVPSVLDPIAALGSLGFSTDGSLPCPTPLPPGGACCLSDGTCLRLSSAECAAAGGEYKGDNSICVPNPCTPEVWACCLPDGSCVEMTAAECASHGNAVYFEGTPCASDPCATIRGACCTVDALCFITTRAICEQYGADFQGEETDCDPNPCPPPAFGACCFASGSCHRLTMSECASQGGSFLGDGVLCDPNPCPIPPMGACCSDNGACVVTDEGSCLLGNGHYIGEGTTCDPSPCPAGACCLTSGACIVEPEEQCVGGGGTFIGSGTDCSPTPCPPGVCCLDDGGCRFLTHPECMLFEGVFIPGETECGPTSCPPGGACCLASHACIVRTEAICTELNGEWSGAGTDCVPSPCGDLIGACCLDDGSCLDLPESACFTQGGLYHGPFTHCDGVDCVGPIGCGSSGVPRWDADNRDAVVTLSPQSLAHGAPPVAAGGECGVSLQNSDGSYENGGAVRNNAVEVPYYGAWAECYHGSYEVCQAVFDFTQAGTQAGQLMDVYVWEDLDGCPGQVLCLRASVDPGPVAFWPNISRHIVDLGGCCTPNDWWIGYWPNWPGQNYGWFTTFDLNPASNGCPKICLAPGIFGVEGWQDASVIWGDVYALGISAGVRACAPTLGACCLADGSCVMTEQAQCTGQFQGVGTICDPNPCPGPVPTERLSWGRVKALYK